MEICISRRFGSALSETTDPSHKEHPQHVNYTRSHRTERSSRSEPRLFPSLDNRRRARVGNIGKSEVNGIVSTVLEQFFVKFHPTLKYIIHYLNIR